VTGDARSWWARRRRSLACDKITYFIFAKVRSDFSPVLRGRGAASAPHAHQPTPLANSPATSARRLVRRDQKAKQMRLSGPFIGMASKSACTGSNRVVCLPACQGKLQVPESSPHQTGQAFFSVSRMRQTWQIALDAEIRLPSYELKKILSGVVGGELSRRDTPIVRHGLGLLMKYRFDSSFVEK
jgi:hypothetical protein